MTETGTLVAHDEVTKEEVYFTDFVYENQRVLIYSSLEAAQEERGGYSHRFVARDADGWFLVSECSDGPGWDRHGRRRVQRATR